MTDNAGTAYINDTPVNFNGGDTILDLVRNTEQGHLVPTLCEDPRLEPYGACRICSVEVAMTQGGPRRIVASCHTPVVDQQRIYTSSERVMNLRRNILELVLTDHPLDCLTCEVNGNCQLQDVAAHTGIRKVRYQPGDNHQSLAKDISHSYLTMDLSKCINCARCVRACDEIQGSFVLNMAGRGFRSRIIKDADVAFAESSCVACGACVETCPTAAISDVFQSKSGIADREVRTVCAYCGVGCNLTVSVRDEKVTSIRAPWDAEVNKGHTCLKGRYAFRFYNHPDRLTKPLIKRGGRFEEVSWDEAFTFIADKLKAVSADFGPDAIAGISSARCTNEENYLMQKMMRAVIGTNNIDGCARVCHAPTAWGMQQSFGTGAATNSIDEIAVADLIMLIGANPTMAHPVTGARIKQRAMGGATLIVIDPLETELARLADYHLQLRPGTNVALLNMMLRHIVEAGMIEAGLVDESFIDSRCEGYDTFLERLLEVDLDRMEAICGVPQDLARQAALAYARASNAMAFHGLGVTEHSQGTKTVMLLADLAMMTGNIGRPGVGLNPLRGQNNVQGAADMGVQPHQGPGNMDIHDPEVIAHYERHFGSSIARSKGKRIPEMFEGALDGSLKCLWIMGEDVVQTDPNSAQVVASLNCLDLLVVQEIFMSETARLADVVLPGASFFEKEGTFTNGERRVQKVNRVVEPLTGCKSDGQIVVEMMRYLGFDQPDYDPAWVLEEIAGVMPSFAGISWSNLGTRGKQWPVSIDGVDTQILHQQEFTRGKGKFHFFEFEESGELVSHAGRFPMILTTARNLVHYNSGTMTRRTANEGMIEEDVLLINRADARSRNIVDGDRVVVVSDRDEILLKAVLTDRVKPGVLHTTFHFPSLNVNLITSDVKDAETSCPEYKVVAVDVQKAQ